MIVEAAIAPFLSPDVSERREAVIVKRLDQIDRRTPRFEPTAQAARAKAGERYDQFVTALGRRLPKGPKLRQEISEDVPGLNERPDGNVSSG